MQRQRYVFDPVLRAYVWRYEDCGPVATGLGGHRPVVRTFVAGGQPAENVTSNGGTKTLPTKDHTA